MAAPMPIDDPLLCLLAVPAPWAASASIAGCPAALAALALEHGAALCTTDVDFARFPGLRTVNPLVDRGAD